MKKHLILIIIAVFICTNIATFLFAHGKVRIVEKVVTAYKEAKEPNYAASMNAGTLSRQTSKTNTDMSEVADMEKYRYPVDSSDYPIGAGMLNSDAAAVPRTAQKPMDNSEQPMQHGGTFYPNSPQSYAPVADGSFSNDGEGIPLPQLPLWDADFEVATSEDDFSGTPPPALPALDEIE